MPTSSWAQIRADISREFGYHDFTGNVNTGKTITAASGALADLFPVEDAFNGWFALVDPTGNNLIRRVTDYDVTASAGVGTLTHVGSALPSGLTSTPVELHRANPDRVQEYANRAAKELFPHVAVIRDHRSLVTGQRQHMYTLPSTIRGGPIRVYLERRQAVNPQAENLFTDPGFENWTDSTTPVSWANTSFTSVNQEAETTTPRNFAVLQDAYSARCVAANTTVCTLLQTVTPTQATEGVKLTVSFWVYCLTASRVSVRIGSTDGTAHGGTGWELITCTVTLGATATDFSAGIVCSSGAVITFYVDEGFAVLGQSEAADHDWDELLNYRWIPPVAGASDGGKLEFDYDLPEKRRLRVLGRDVLSALGTDGSTVEVDGEHLALLYDKTKLYVARELINEASRGDKSAEEIPHWRELAAECERRVQDALANGMAVPAPKTRLRIPDWSF